MFKSEISGILMMLLLLTTSTAILSTGCYQDDNDARVTIHFERHDLAFYNDFKHKKFFEIVLDFFNTPAFAASTWSSVKDDLTLTVSENGIDGKIFTIPAGTIEYSIIIPSGSAITFIATCTYSAGSFKNWGGHNTVNIIPGDQSIQLNMIPMTYFQAQSGSTSIMLNWYKTDVSGNTQSYNIYRASSSTGQYSFLKNVTPATSEGTNDVPPNGTYYYKICVVSTSGEEGVLSDYTFASKL